MSAEVRLPTAADRRALRLLRVLVASRRQPGTDLKLDPRHQQVDEDRCETAERPRGPAVDLPHERSDADRGADRDQVESAAEGCASIRRRRAGFVQRTRDHERGEHVTADASGREQKDLPASGIPRKCWIVAPAPQVESVRPYGTAAVWTTWASEFL